MVSEKYKRYPVLVSSMVSFTICFMVWMMLAVVGIPVKEKLGLIGTQFSILAVLPVLSGSLIRVPLGIWTDKYGGRIVMFVLMMVSVLAISLMGYAYVYWYFLLTGLTTDLAGGTFSVDAPYVAHWFPKEQQGLVMGVSGAGNVGSAVNELFTLALIAYGTWYLVPTVYAVIMLGTALLFWFTSYHDPKHLASSSVSLKEQFAPLKNPGVLRYSQYYSVVPGGCVMLALRMTHYYVDEYGLNLKTATLLVVCFSLPGGVLHASGDHLSDRFGAYRVTWAVMRALWVCFLLLFYSQTDFIIHGKGGNIPTRIGLSVVPFTVLMFTAGIAVAVGKASVFELVADDYSYNISAVLGVVGLAGGLGDFPLPIMFGTLVDLTGVCMTSFMLLYGMVCFSLAWIHFSFKVKVAHR